MCVGECVGERLIPMLERVAERCHDAVLRLISNGDGRVEIFLLNRTKETIERLAIALALLVQQEEHPLQHHGKREDRRQKKRPHDRAALDEEMHEIRLLHQRLQRTTARGIKCERAFAGLDQRADGRCEFAFERPNERLVGARLRNGKTSKTIGGAEQRHRTDHGELTLRNSAKHVNANARESRAANDIEDALDRDINKRCLATEAFWHRKRLVFSRFLGRENCSAAILQLYRIDLGFESARILVEQIADIAQLVLSSLELLLDARNVKRARVDQTRHAIALLAKSGDLLLKTSQLLRERKLLVGDLLAKCVEFEDAFGKPLIGAARNL